MSNQEELLNFCHNVKTVRRNMNLSKAKMAKVMGIGIHSLNLIENGVFPERLGINAVVKFCFTFGISLKDAFTKL